MSISEKPKLWIPNKDSCQGCSRLSKNGKCRTDVKICGCNSPEVLQLYEKSPYIAICKNCNHFIIYIGIDRWEHYTRAYKCSYPYHEMICQALHPNDRESSIEFDLHLQKMQGISFKKINEDETKALKELENI